MSYIVNFWQALFGFLKNISLFGLVGKIFPSTNTSYTFVDSWFFFFKQVVESITALTKVPSFLVFRA